jgi:hypothetical protein
MSDHGVEHYPLPAVEPPRGPGVTFSAQRYNPLYLPPTLPVGGGATGQRFNDVEEMILGGMPPVLLPALAFPPPRAVVSFLYTLSSICAYNSLSTYFKNQLQNSYRNAGMGARSIKRWVTAFSTAAGAALRDVFRRVCDATRVCYIFFCDLQFY